MANDYFNFREFTVYHDQCAMKVGTDAVLIGAWTDLGCSRRILDIGTGTGIIALMCAQRCGASIVAVDIDEGAVRQARSNVAASPWGDRIEVMHGDITRLAQGVEFQHQFDTLISNPPYFQEQVKCPEAQRNMARHTDSLTFDELLGAAECLLCDGGTLSVVLPAAAAADFITLALRHGLYLCRQTWVHTKVGKVAKRVLMCFMNGVVGATVSGHLNMRDVNGVVDEEYRRLTEEFYLF